MHGTELHYVLTIRRRDVDRNGITVFQSSADMLCVRRLFCPVVKIGIGVGPDKSRYVRARRILDIINTHKGQLSLIVYFDSFKGIPVLRLFQTFYGKCHI